MPVRAFIDSDVIIASLISQTGASHLLYNNTSQITLYISNVSHKELEKVVGRLNLDLHKLAARIQSTLHVIQLAQTIAEIKKAYQDYVTDQDDAHIVAGAKAANAQFLVTYNIKHFVANKLKQDFSIILVTPANVLQYLRSR